ncbi:MAG: hypothetical protein GY757_53660 [bacterium]|nr:hypothetical protein [bacterium]
MINIATIEVTFHLPPWWPPERLHYSNPVYFDKYHAWAGSYSHSNEGNSAEDSIYKIKGCIETCSHPMGPWVKFEMDPDESDPVKWIEQTQAKLTRHLKRYKEARKE